MSAPDSTKDVQSVDSRESLDGVTWTPTGQGEAELVLEVRDWRWLWLRKRRVVLGTYLPPTA